MSPTSISNHFLWGVSTSSYQSEGGYNQPGQPQNNWAEAERCGSVASTLDASGFWERHTEDFDTCQNLGINGFRMSLEWAKIQPIPALRCDKPIFNYQALDDYVERLLACRQRGIEPVLTLQHFTHPMWLGVDAWLNPETIEAYLIYVQTTVRYLNQRLVDHYHVKPLQWLITINEPNILVINTYLNGSFPSKTGTSLSRALRAFDHLLSAHVRAYDVIHQIYDDEGWESPRVSLNTYCSDIYWSEKIVWDLFSLARSPIPRRNLARYWTDRAHELEVALNQADLKFRRDIPFKVGSLVRKIIDQLGRLWIKPETFDATLTAIENSRRGQVFDYLAIDYYDPFLAHSFRFPNFADLEFDFSDFKGWVMSSMQTRWWDWRSLPEGLYFFCHHYMQEYAPAPLLIAENGMALRRTYDNRTATFRRDQLTRSQFLREHLAQVQKLRDDGLPIAGYMHWSLTDNYEWGSFTPRFGLFSINYEQGTERLETDHLGDSPAQTYANLIRHYSTVRAERPSF